MSCEPIECPICYDIIEEKNNITTECGHKFHASCLMNNITRNGFGCPCCRLIMAEFPEEEEEDEDDEGTLLDESDDDDDDDDETLLDDDTVFADDDDALRGLRLFTNLLQGHQHDEEDIIGKIPKSNLF